MLFLEYFINVHLLADAAGLREEVSIAADEEGFHEYTKTSGGRNPGRIMVKIIGEMGLLFGVESRWADKYRGVFHHKLGLYRI